MLVHALHPIDVAHQRYLLFTRIIFSLIDALRILRTGSLCFFLYQNPMERSADKHLLVVDEISSPFCQQDPASRKARRMLSMALTNADVLKACMNLSSSWMKRQVKQSC